jgi:hypothetical protein
MQRIAQLIDPVIHCRMALRLQSNARSSSELRNDSTTGVRISSKRSASIVHAAVLASIGSFYSSRIRSQMSKIDQYGDSWNLWRSEPPDSPCLRSGESQRRPVKSRNGAKHKIIRTTQTTPAPRSSPTGSCPCLSKTAYPAAFWTAA